MKFQLITIAALTASSVSAYTPANPFVKNPARAVVNVDVLGAMVKRQTTCPQGYSACGTGCAAGPCCDSTAGLACRAGETCATINGQLACCAEGFVCDTVRDCESAVTGCVPGSVTDGVLCCDASAPMCNTVSGTPYCSGAAASTTYIAGGGSGGPAPTDTVSVTSTSTEVVTGTVTDSATGGPVETTTAVETSTAVETTTDVDTASVTATSTDTDTATVTYVPTTASATILPIPTSNVTGNATVTVLPTPTEATSGAMGLSVSGAYVLAAVMGLVAFAL